MLKENLDIAIKAALVAGEKIMEIYNSDFDVEFKSDESPLTKADTAANAIINSYLLDTKIPIISEENKAIDFKDRKDWYMCWVVDPVDGTKEFIKRNGEFTVNIALVINNKPILGVIYAPVLQTLYYANVENETAYKSKLEKHNSTLEEVFNKSEALPLQLKSSKTTHIVGSKSHMNDETKMFIENLPQKNIEILPVGSSLKFCIVAEGKASIYPRFAPTMEWDTAAGQAICNAVGINVISQETNKPLVYNKENLLNPWFLVHK